MWRFAHCDCGHLAFWHNPTYGCMLCGGMGLCWPTKVRRR